MSARSIEWHARHKRGESYIAIAKEAGVTRRAVYGAVQRYEASLHKVDGRRKTDGPTRAELRAAKAPQPPKGPRRQPVDPVALQAFDTATQTRGCLWVEGDIRDSASVCALPRTNRAYCDAHHAKAHDGRPRKPMQP